MAKDFSKSFYNSKEWKQVRESILIRDAYLCVMCGKPAEEVHHKIHLTPNNINNKMITSGADNLISLCGNCHKAVHGHKNGNNINVLPKIGFDKDGNIVEIQTAVGCK